MKKQLLILILMTVSLTAGAHSISDDMTIEQLTDKVYVYTATAPIEGWGMVASNGMIVIDNDEAFLFDTPTTAEQTETLATFIADSLHAKIVGFVPNHWHADCVAGMDLLHCMGVTSYANEMTIDILKELGRPYPMNGFGESLSLTLNDTEIVCYYFGGGHSLDNIVVWLPSEQILFGGCMVKDIHATTLGNTADGDVVAWPETIGKVQEMFPSAKIVIPGHGDIGGPELLEHTRELITSLTAK